MSSCVVPHYRLLLVDAYPQHRDATAALLRDLGYGVTFSPPEEAPPNGAGDALRLPLRAADLVRAIRGGLDRSSDG